MAATTAVNVRLPKEVVEILDTLVERQLFLSRSEAIREFCRDYLKGNLHSRKTYLSKSMADFEAGVYDSGEIPAEIDSVNIDSVNIYSNKKSSKKRGAVRRSFRRGVR